MFRWLRMLAGCGCAGLLILSGGVAVADCCQWPIIFMPNQQIQQQFGQNLIPGNPGGGSSKPPGKKPDDGGSGSGGGGWYDVPPDYPPYPPPVYPPEGGEEDGGEGEWRVGGLSAARLAAGTFREPVQQAVIAWNGSEEILVLSTRQQSLLKGQGAVLSCLPVPGRPINVKKADPELYKNLVGLITRKARERGDAVGGGLGMTVLFKKEIGAHNIFAVEVDSVTEFTNEVANYIGKTYGSRAAVVLTDRHRSVINTYLKRGFRHFVFDLQFADNKQKEKEAIAYHFKSDRVFFPLQISQIGGVGETEVNLAVITPGPLTRFRGLNPDLISAWPKPAVKVSQSELAKLDKDIAALFKGREALARRFVIRGQLNGFKADLNGYLE